MSLNHRNNRNFDYFSPKFSYYNQIYTFVIDFVKISTKSTSMIPTIHIKK